MQKLFNSSSGRERRINCLVPSLGEIVINTRKLKKTKVELTRSMLISWPVINGTSG